ncbi:MAG TPA: hypothetical protein VIG25_16275 [Pyrinomonadaceae bacterium]|jgi:hypothetical protein
MNKKTSLLILHPSGLILSFALLISLSTAAQSQTDELSNWIGQYPLIPKVNPRRGIYTSPELRPKLIALLGRKYYRRLVYDYYVMAKIESIDGYLVAQMCRQHFCPSAASFMAVNLTRGDIHVAFWRSGYIEWFHTRGKAKDLPDSVRRKPWWMNVTPDKVREVTRREDEG